MEECAAHLLLELAGNPRMSTINPRSIVIATLFFAVSSALLVAASPFLVSYWPGLFGGGLWGGLGLLFLVFWAASGVLAGYLAGAAGAYNGAVLGLPTGLVALLGPWLIFDWHVSMTEHLAQNALPHLVAGVVLCGLGGLLWDITRKFRG